MRVRKMAPSKKYAVWKDPKKTTKVLLLLKDDERKYLTETQRENLLLEVGKEYGKAKKEQDLERQPKISIAEAAGLPLDELIKGIKQGTIVV